VVLGRRFGLGQFGSGRREELRRDELRIELRWEVGAPQLLPGVRAELGRLSWPTEVVSSQIGDLGTVVGAARLAVARGVQNVTEGAQAKD
ncbi:hypothetical protein ABZ474_52725, partial [Streptomyces mirabilis]